MSKTYNDLVLDQVTKYMKSDIGTLTSTILLHETIVCPEIVNGKKCGGILEYNETYTQLHCIKCRKQYSITDAAKLIK